MNKCLLWDFREKMMYFYEHPYKDMYLDDPNASKSVFRFVHHDLESPLFDGLRTVNNTLDSHIVAGLDE